jgi:hypothetical protein
MHITFHDRKFNKKRAAVHGCDPRALKRQEREAAGPEPGLNGPGRESPPEMLRHACMHAG